ncbi:MAG: hypothetical protein Q9226_004640 [Calogaya cf. arnoldii]
MDPQPTPEPPARQPAEDCRTAIGGLRASEHIQADIRMPGSISAPDPLGPPSSPQPRSSEDIQADIEMPGSISAPDPSRPPSSPRPRARTLKENISLEERMAGSDECMPGTTSAPAFPEPPSSPRPQARTFPPSSPRRKARTRPPSSPRPQVQVLPPILPPSHHPRPPRRRTYAPSQLRSPSQQQLGQAIPPKVPMVQPEPPDPPKGCSFVVSTYFPGPPELHPAPPYHLWPPTTVMFEYLHARGLLSLGRIENEAEYYPVVPKHVVLLCEFFNNTKLQDTTRDKSLWKDHLYRVTWLQWCWDERERARAKRYKEHDDFMQDLIRARMIRDGVSLFLATKSIMFKLEERERHKVVEVKNELDVMRDLDSKGPDGPKEGDEKYMVVHMAQGSLLGRAIMESREHEASQQSERNINEQAEENSIRMGNGEQNGKQNENQNVRPNGDQNGRPNGDQSGNANRQQSRRRNRRFAIWTDANDEDSRHYTVPVNAEGEEDPNGLTQYDWDLTESLESSLEVREGASTEEMVRETVLWAIDVNETGEMWKRQRADESKDDEPPTNRRLMQVRRRGP